VKSSLIATLERIYPKLFLWESIFVIRFERFISPGDWILHTRGTPEALYYRRFLHGVHLPANQRRLPPLPTDLIGWEVYAM